LTLASQFLVHMGNNRRATQFSTSSRSTPLSPSHLPSQAEANTNNYPNPVTQLDRCVDAAVLRQVAVLAIRRHEEPAAVAFSFANLVIHVLGVDWLRHGVHSSHPMRPFYITWAYVSVNGWIWSAVFHTRGTSVSVLASILSVLVSVPFAPHIHPSSHLPHMRGSCRLYIT
jgi:hypothetical protein